MSEDAQLTRPYRRIDLALLVVGVFLVLPAVAIGSPGFYVPAGLLFLLGTSTDVVSLGLERFTGDALERGGDVDEDTGWLIGKLENVIVFVLVLAGAWTALSIVFAAKSIIRREDISSGNTTYYLAGTLLNFTYSILLGLIISWVIGRMFFPL